MSRSGYDEDYDGSNWDMICWRGRVASSTRGKRGQAMLKELLEALDAMPKKELIAEELQEGADGAVCALGALGVKRGLDMSKIDPEDYSTVANKFGVAEPLVQEIVNVNDEWGPYKETPEHRWGRMRAWIASLIAADVSNKNGPPALSSDGPS